jgi:hypothetical protein
MRSSLRFLLPLIFSVALVSVLFAAYQSRTENRNLRRELQRRALLLAESLQENIEPVLLKPEPAADLERIVEKFGHREHLEGIAVYNQAGAPLALTPGLDDSFRVRPQAATNAAAHD